jgi:hypothetical protein
VRRGATFAAGAACAIVTLKDWPVVVFTVIRADVRADDSESTRYDAPAALHALPHLFELGAGLYNG